MIIAGMSMHAVHATDMPTKKAPAAPSPALTWTGLYIGFNTGYSWTASAPLNIATYNLYDASTGFGNASALGGTGTINGQLNGFLSGGQLGYNWQFSEKFIVGVEADLQGAGVRGGGDDVARDCGCITHSREYTCCPC